MQRFDVKLPAEENVLTFNMAPGLLNGNLLSGTPTVTVTTFSGNDASPTLILNGSAQLDSTQTMVLLPVKGGLDFCDYLITVVCNTNVATVELGLQGILPVRANP